MCVLLLISNRKTTRSSNGNFFFFFFKWWAACSCFVDVMVSRLNPVNLSGIIKNVGKSFLFLSLSHGEALDWPADLVSNSSASGYRPKELHVRVTGLICKAAIINIFIWWIAWIPVCERGSEYRLTRKELSPDSAVQASVSSFLHNSTLDSSHSVIIAHNKKLMSSKKWLHATRQQQTSKLATSWWTWQLKERYFQKQS